MTDATSHIASNLQLPTGWIETTLGEVAEVLNGYAFKSSDLGDYSFGLMPVFKMGNIHRGGGLRRTGKEDFYQGDALQINKKFQTQENDILMSMTDMQASMELLGYSARIRDEKFLVNQRVGIIRSLPGKIDPLYLSYFMNTNYYIDNVRTKANSGVQVNLTTTGIKESPVILPPLPEQHAIASVLSVFDDKIELLREENKTLEQTAQTIFQEWFGKYSVDSELPEGWRVGKLSEIAEFLNGVALQKFPPENENDYLPVVKIRELKAGITEQTDKASKNIDPKYIVDDGDVLFSWSGSLELVIWKYGKGALNQHLFKVSSQKYSKWFYYFWTLYHLEDFRSIASNKATTMGHIQRHHLDQAQVIIPDNETLQKLDQQISPILEKIMLINQEIQFLACSRDELLPRLMRGEVRVKF